MARHRHNSKKLIFVSHAHEDAEHGRRLSKYWLRKSLLNAVEIFVSNKDEGSQLKR